VFARRERIGVARYGVHKNAVAFRSVVVTRFFKPCRDPLPFFELLVISYKAKRNGVEPNQSAVFSHARHAGCFGVFGAG
jgi:hypothetical protein